MEEILRQATTILRSAWKYRRLGMLSGWLVGAIAAGIILRIPDRYEASARISLDTQSILKPLMSGLAVQPNVEWQVMMLSRTLISRPNVEKVVRMADVDLGVQNKVAREAQIEALTKALEINSINTMVGRDTAALRREAAEIFAGRGKRGRVPEFWDGHAAERIANDLSDWLLAQHQSRAST